jgi:hypothetical protein
LHPSELVVLEGVAPEIVLLQTVFLQKPLPEVARCVALLVMKVLRSGYNQSVKSYDIESWTY